MIGPTLLIPQSLWVGGTSTYGRFTNEKKKMIGFKNIEEAAKTLSCPVYAGLSRGRDAYQVLEVVVVCLAGHFARRITFFLTLLFILNNARGKGGSISRVKKFSGGQKDQDRLRGYLLVDLLCYHFYGGPYYL